MALSPSAASLGVHSNSQTLQGFTVNIANNGGTLQHRILSDLASAAAPDFDNKINAANHVETSTPTGADASTAFAGGGKVGSVNQNRFILDTPAAQATTEGMVSAVISLNKTGTDLTVQATRISRDVNGVTMSRIELDFEDTATGAAFNLNTTNIASGKRLDVTIFGFIR
jgi:hypothetical protein